MIKRTCKRCIGCCTALYNISKKDDFPIPWEGINLGTLTKRQRVDRILSICPLLTFSKNGETNCIIYKERPQICEDFYCEYMTDRRFKHNPFPVK
jgi:hypothetical protein